MLRQCRLSHHSMLYVWDVGQTGFVSDRLLSEGRSEHGQRKLFAESGKLGICSFEHC